MKQHNKGPRVGPQDPPAQNGINFVAVPYQSNIVF